MDRQVCPHHECVHPPGHPSHDPGRVGPRPEGFSGHYPWCSGTLWTLRTELRSRLAAPDTSPPSPVQSSLSVICPPQAPAQPPCSVARGTYIISTRMVSPELHPHHGTLNVHMLASHLPSTHSSLVSPEKGLCILSRKLT